MRSLTFATMLALLLFASIVIGTVAADLPYWRRAVAWLQAESGWPEVLPGASIPLHGAEDYKAVVLPPLEVVDDPAHAREVLALLEAQLARVSPGAAEALRPRVDTQALLVAHQGTVVLEQYGASVTADTLLNGRELTGALTAILLGIALRDGKVHSLDEPLTNYVPEWAGDARGVITLRQVLWNLSGLENPAPRYWNPFGKTGRLASGPDFTRAALSYRRNYPAGSHFAASPANPQLLALVLERATEMPIADYLQQKLWTPAGGGNAVLLADRPSGDAAAHCCLRATARDWLRLGLILAAADDRTVSGPPAAAPLVSAQWLAQLTQASAVNPGYGLGLVLDGPPGAPPAAFHLEGHGRRIWVLPAEDIVVLHFVNIKDFASKAAP